jgi:hypothetical protein
MENYKKRDVREGQKGPRVIFLTTYMQVSDTGRGGRHFIG